MTGKREFGMHAYFDCFSGISGNMALGALIDLGVPLDWLQDKLKGLPLEGFELATTTVNRNGIDACHLEVKLADRAPNRDYQDIKILLAESSLEDEALDQCLGVFGCLASAEAGVHGCSIDDVHFHEVGGVDCIVDIVGTVLGLSYLGVHRVSASALPLGRGWVECQHGTLPVPAPATLAIVKDKQIPVTVSSIQAELTTPTGASLIGCLAKSYGALPTGVVKAIGYGAGSRVLNEQPNLLRLVLMEVQPSDIVLGRGAQFETVSVIETNVDDMNPELFSFLMERLFEDGALDVSWVPIYMKKNRPATLIQVIAHPESQDRLIRRLLTETTSLGVRCASHQRVALRREAKTVESRRGPLPVKKIWQLDGQVRLVPEYEVCRQIALEEGLPLREAYNKILKIIRDQEA
jgi:uncharacterized protein (TIGR00299 family) protein